MIIGIDPGNDGAIALLSDDEIQLWDIDGSLVDAINRLALIKRMWPVNLDGAVIEKVGAFPGQGRQSCFVFGANWGHLRGACIALGIPILAEPIPAKWKAAIFGAGKRPKEKSALKQLSRDKARELFPSASADLARKKDADRAEALLLAEYGRRLLRGDRP